MSRESARASLAKYQRIRESVRFVVFLRLLERAHRDAGLRACNHACEGVGSNRRSRKPRPDPQRGSPGRRDDE